jgi:uncharacterized membrane protein
MTPAEADDLKQRVAQLEVTLKQVQTTLQQMLARQLAQEPSIFAEDISPTLGNLSQAVPTQVESLPTVSTVPIAPRPPSTAPITTNVADTSTVADTTATPPGSVPVPTPTAQPMTTPAIQTWEFWLNRVGIGLLLLGVVFLFKYSIDQGWLTPPIRVGFGLMVGAILVGLGLKLEAQRRTFSQVLIGGGLGTFYISGFAAFQVLQIVAYPVAFGFMVAVTLLGFCLSLRQNSAVLSVIAAVGGLGTPFLLYGETENLTGLIGYTLLLLLGSGAIFWKQGWRALLWTNFVTGWLILLIAVIVLETNTRLMGETATQIGIAAAGVLFALLPVGRLRHENQVRRSALANNFESTLNSAKSRPGEVLAGLELMVVLTPLFVLWFSQPLWDLPGRYWGYGLIAVAIFYGLAGRQLSKRLPSLAFTHVLTSFLLLAIALVLLLQGNWLFLMLVGEAVILHLLAHRHGNFKLRVAAHLLSAALGLELFNRLAMHGPTPPAIFNWPGLINLAVIVTAVTLTRYLRLATSRSIYLAFAHVMTLAWLLRELLPFGSGYVTLAWGFYGIVLLILGLRLDQSLLRWGGLSTLFLVVFKLFVFDLTGLEPIWRILLFMGFGVVFLALSYFFRNLWKTSRTPLRKASIPEELDQIEEQE